LRIKEQAKRLTPFFEHDDDEKMACSKSRWKAANQLEDRRIIRRRSVYRRVFGFVHSNISLTEKHFKFRKGLSMGTAVFSFMDVIC
jgi:isopenicillin N synthase-like dioxygenase